MPTIDYGHWNGRRNRLPHLAGSIVWQTRWGRRFRLPAEAHFHSIAHPNPENGYAPFREALRTHAGHTLEVPPARDRRRRRRIARDGRGEARSQTPQDQTVGPADEAGHPGTETRTLLASVTPLALHLFPRRLMAVGLAVGLVEVIVGTLAGAWLYREQTT